MQKEKYLFGERILAYKKTNALSYDELAERTGVHKNTLRKWVENRARPTWGKAELLCELMGVDPLEFVELQGPLSEKKLQDKYRETGLRRGQRFVGLDEMRSTFERGQEVVEDYAHVRAQLEKMALVAETEAVPYNERMRIARLVDQVVEGMADQLRATTHSMNVLAELGAALRKVQH